MRTLIAAAVFCLSASAALAQEAPPRSPSRTEVVLRLRQHVRRSGLTSEQIRARLHAAGYSADVLDPYLSEQSGERAIPNNEVFLAVVELGIAPATDVELYRRMQPDSIAGTARDPLMADSLAPPGPADSLGRRPAGRRGFRADIADSIARLDSGYNVFGLEFFQSASLRPDQDLTGPVDESYRLGPGDQLALILTGDVELVQSFEINREGSILIPSVGQVYVASLTLAELRDLFYARLGRIYSGLRRDASATTRFSVSVTRLRAIQVFVLGDVARPGSYVLPSVGTALTALYAAGGPTLNGSLRNIAVRRGTRDISTLDLYDYLMRGDASHDPRLESGDIVFVPPRSFRVRILGEVIRPATYELKPGESLAALLTAAGGLRAEASHRRIQIERIIPPGERTADGRDRATIDYHADDLASGAASRIPLEAGDVVKVFAVAARVTNTITVMGNVWSPGPLGLEPGMKIADALHRAGGPKPDVYLGQVLVTRLAPDSSRVQLRASLQDSVGNVINDFQLQDNDLIEVFSIAGFRAERYVAIGGAVRKPGRYPYRRGMTMRDLVLLADGLQESAYLKDAEIARLPADRSGNTTALTMHVALDSSYLYEAIAQGQFLTANADGNGRGNARSPDVQLEAYDNVLIKQQPNWQLQRTVTIMGEIAFPGQYALITRDERLSDLVNRAGGLSAEAYPEGTIFTRRKSNIGRVAIDVPTALKKAKSPENLVLMDGDEIYIPQRSFVVSVTGAVNAPNVVAYVPGKGVDYYVQQAGGARRDGDRKAAYVTQPNGKREIGGWLHEPTPLAGSVVEVPVNPAPRQSWMQTLAGFTPVITSIITTYLLLKSL